MTPEWCAALGGDTDDQDEPEATEHRTLHHAPDWRGDTGTWLSGPVLRTEYECAWCDMEAREGHRPLP